MNQSRNLERYKTLIGYSLWNKVNNRSNAIVAP